MVVISMMQPASPRASGITSADPEETGPKEVSNGYSRWYTDGHTGHPQRQTVHHDPSHHGGPRCPERQAHTKLMGSTGGGERGDPIQPHERQRGSSQPRQPVRVSNRPRRR